VPLSPGRRPVLDRPRDCSVTRSPYRVDE